MKYWNKDKTTRRNHWFKVERSVGKNWNYDTIKRALQREPSTGKFYLYYGSKTIWFEREQDAVWFELKYS